MRKLVGVLGCMAVGVLMAGCASSKVTYVKKGADRHDLAVDKLECSARGVAAHKSSLSRTPAADPQAGQKAAAASRAAIDRCAQSRGYRKFS
jgi:hypothetical protein